MTHTGHLDAYLGELSLEALDWWMHDVGILRDLRTLVLTDRQIVDLSLAIADYVAHSMNRAEPATLPIVDFVLRTARTAPSVLEPLLCKLEQLDPPATECLVLHAGRAAVDFAEGRRPGLPCPGMIVDALCELEDPSGFERFFEELGRMVEQITISTDQIVTDLREMIAELA